MSKEGPGKLKKIIIKRAHKYYLGEQNYKKELKCDTNIILDGQEKYYFGRTNL